MGSVSFFLILVTATRASVLTDPHLHSHTPHLLAPSYSHPSETPTANPGEVKGSPASGKGQDFNHQGK